MTASHLPARITVAEAVSQGRKFSAQLPIASLPRLSEAILPSPGSVTVELACIPDEASLGRIRGRLSGSVQLTCQRCLQAAAFPLEAAPDWTLVATEADEERLLESRDPLLVDEGGQLALLEAIEDEAIMALPIVALCSTPDCATAANGGADGEDLGHNRRPSDARPNPFAAIKGQLKG